MEQSKDEFMKRIDLSISVIEETGLSLSEDLEMAIRFTEDFYLYNKDFIKQISLKIKKPILVEMWKEKFFYFILKWEFNYIDNLGKASALSTDQIDVENALRYGITFIDENGDKKHPIILHNSPSGVYRKGDFCIAGEIIQNDETRKNTVFTAMVNEYPNSVNSSKHEFYLKMHGNQQLSQREQNSC